MTKRSPSWRWLVVSVVACLVLGNAWADGAMAISGEAQTALERVGIRRGVCAALGLPKKGDAGFVVDLARGSELLVYFQSAKADDVAAVRKAAEEAGLLGERVFMDCGDLKSVHLADNVAGAVIVVDGNVPEKELLRILHPEGKAVVGSKEIVKPFPEGIDPWSHPYHGPDNNPQSSDQMARWPYLTQFIAGPKFSPMPEVTVGAGGRIFTAHGHLSFKANQNAVLNTLIAMNGYNGRVLWTRKLREGFMIHRNTMIATPDVLYLGDDESCKVLDARTGEVKDEIKVPDGISDGPVWKWMALKDGVLYALVGGEEGKVRTGKSSGKGIGHWRWNMWRGYGYKNPTTNPGFGRTLLAIDPKTKKVLWHHREEEYLDSRGVCMRNGRIYVCLPEKFLASIDAKEGKVLWKRMDEDLVQAIGPTGRAQNWVTGFSPTAYIKCNDKYILLAGPHRQRLVAASAEDGKLLWTGPDGNVQLVLRDDALYAIGKQGGKSRKVSYDKGETQGQFLGRRACTRATGSIDSIFYRVWGGTVRVDLTGDTPQPTHIAPMRPACNDGVIISDGYVYWSPWMCGCALSLYGHIGLGPASGVDLHPEANGSRLETGQGVTQSVKGSEPDPKDWPQYNRNSARQPVTEVPIPTQIVKKWECALPVKSVLTGPVMANGVVFVGNAAGVVRALGAEDGKERWKAYTGGRIVFSPVVSQGRVYAGSCDGWVYAFEAASGRLLWRYRLAPVERRIAVFGRLISRWPVAGGVVVEDGVVYAAAGIAHYDGTYVCALDAVTGEVKWYNDTSGELSPGVKNGVSLQGVLSLQENDLVFNGGNATGPAKYDRKTGKCLGRTDGVGARSASAFYAYYPEYGRYLSLNYAFPDGRTLKSEARYDTTRFKGPTLTSTPQADAKGRKRGQTVWSKSWPCMAIVIGPNAVLVAREIGGGQTPACALEAVKLEDGSSLWVEELPGVPAKGGVAIDSKGRIVVSLENGKVLCYGGKG